LISFKTLGYRDAAFSKRQKINQLEDEVPRPGEAKVREGVEELRQATKI